jgi:CBS domain containing-hemolysin-like protein
MALPPVVAILLMLGFAGISTFFALAESALFSLGKWRACQLAERSGAGGRRVVELLKAPQDLLATIALGNTFANAGLVAIGLLTALRQAWPTVPTLVGLLVLCLVGCEVVPKTLAVRAPEQWALLLARPMALVVLWSEPLRRIAQRMNAAILRAVVPSSVKPQAGISDDEYRELLELACQQGTLAPSEKEIILQIISLDRRKAREVMRPRSRMISVSDDATIEEMIEIARKYKHRRLPIYDQETDSIVGILNTRTLLLNPQVDLVDAIEFPSFVPETMNLLQLFKSLQRQHRGMAIVLDEYGGTAGVVRMEDILQELFGTFRGESEADGFVFEKLGEGRWRVNGTMRVEDFQREYPALPPLAGVETMGGLVMTLLGVVPSPGQSVVHGGLLLTVQAADERRVREVLVETLKRKGGQNGAS